MTAKDQKLPQMDAKDDRSDPDSWPNRQRDLIERYGELMPGSAIQSLLHFTSDRSFRRAAARQALPVTVFRVPGRRGWFARTRDVVAWLDQVAAVGSSLAPTVKPEEDDK